MVEQAIATHKLSSCDACQRIVTSGSDKLKMLGESIAKRRKQLGISQIVLSEKSRVAQAIISRIEKGKRVSRLISIYSELGLEVRAIPWQFLPAIDQWLNESRTNNGNIHYVIENQKNYTNSE
jgi:transcriptional regulator with XRE-family HTH domain